MATKLAKVIADFRTSLATKISIGGTTATLQSATDDDSVALPAGKYYFTCDGDNMQKEYFLCDLSGTALTNLVSVSRQGAQTSGAVREHRVGASMIITNFAHIKCINDLLDGTTNFNASVPLGYDGTASITTNNQFATKAYADGLTFAGAPDATPTQKGIGQLGTDTQLQNGTDTGTTGASTLAHGSNFNQTPTANKVPVANSAGKLLAGWGGAASTLATLNASSLVVENPANASVTPTANYIPIANSSGLISSSWLDLLLRGTGSDGAVTLGAGTTTLTRDMYYTTLIVPNGATLKTNGYRVYATASVTIDAGGIVDFSGNNGTAGGNATAAAVGAGGSGGAALNSGTVFGSYAGGTGGAGGTSAVGTAGTAGTSSSDVYGVAGTAGSAGGAAGVTSGGAGGAAGTKADAGSRLQDLISLFQVSNPRGGTVNQITPSTGCGGGGGGGSNAVGTYGGGGAGAPSGGGVIFFSTRVFTNNGTVSSNGGNGANGGSGYAAANAAGGGGASSGAPGGLIIIIANSIPSYGTLNVNGGTGGTGGAGGSAGGAAGTSGGSGTAGTTFAFII